MIFSDNESGPLPPQLIDDSRLNAPESTPRVLTPHPANGAGRIHGQNRLQQPLTIHLREVVKRERPLEPLADGLVQSLPIWCGRYSLADEDFPGQRGSDVLCRLGCAYLVRTDCSISLEMLSSRSAWWTMAGPAADFV
jgi:hypothetical protein